MDSWARHPPPSFFRRWQEYTLRLAAGGLLIETWSSFFPAISTAAPNSRLVSYVEGRSDDVNPHDPPLSWITWTQILAARSEERRVGKEC